MPPSTVTRPAYNRCPCTVHTSRLWLPGTTQQKAKLPGAAAEGQAWNKEFPGGFPNRRTAHGHTAVSATLRRALQGVN
jgi:hypothetical protein